MYRGSLPEKQRGTGWSKQSRKKL